IRNRPILVRREWLRKRRTIAMAKKTYDKEQRSADLLEKLLVFKLYALGATQDRIAKAVGRQKAWVNELVKGVPNGGQSGGRETQGKTETRRRRHRRSRSAFCR